MSAKHHLNVDKFTFDKGNFLKKLERSKTRPLFTDSNLEWYLEEIGKTPLLSRKEESALARRSISGDEKAKEKLITANLRFVVKIAKQYQNYHTSLLDLINEGNLGLMHAASKFDPDLGYHFITYAVWWIKQYIHIAINQKEEIIRIPVNRSVYLHKIHKIQGELRNELGREPTLDEIAEKLDLSVDKLNKLQSSLYKYISMDQSFPSDSKYPRKENIKDDSCETPESSLIEEALHESLKKIIDALNPDEKEILNHRFGLSGKERLSLEKIGEKFDLSKERVRQIEAKALQKLKMYGEKQNLQDFL